MNCLPANQLRRWRWWQRMERPQPGQPRSSWWPRSWICQGRICLDTGTSNGEEDPVTQDKISNYDFQKLFLPETIRPELVWVFCCSQTSVPGSASSRPSAGWRHPPGRSRRTTHNWSTADASRNLLSSLDEQYFLVLRTFSRFCGILDHFLIKICKIYKSIKQLK